MLSKAIGEDNNGGKRNVEKRLIIQLICKITRKGDQSTIKLSKFFGWWEGKKSKFFTISLCEQESKPFVLNITGQSDLRRRLESLRIEDYTHLGYIGIHRYK